MVFLENVEGIISAKLTGDNWPDPAGTPVLLHILRELERCGYTVEAGVFSAAEVGAPHQRKRVFILAKSSKPGLQRRERPGAYEERQAQRCGLWPARPGEPQHEWEEPRVVGNPKTDHERRRLQPGDHREGIADRRSSRSKGTKTHSGLGGTANGPTPRLDRLRLLGNGVVPQTAEKAFITLYNRSPTV